MNAAVTEVFTQTAHTPFITWKDAPALGHLMGSLTRELPCPLVSLDGYPLTLSGPVSRQLLTAGSGWFGAVDLPPGTYQLSVELLNPNTTIQVPVEITAGAVTEKQILLPNCVLYEIYLPLVLR